MRTDTLLRAASCAADGERLVNRAFLCMAFGLLFFLQACAAKPAARRFEFTKLAMGVQAKVVLYSADSQSATEAARAAFDRIEQLEQILSDYRSDSELMRLCARAGEGPIGVSEDLFDVMALALGFSEASDGAFDVSIGAVVRLWRAARGAGELPKSLVLDEARARSGWKLVELDRAGRRVNLVSEGMRLDMGAIGKGYAADEAVLTLRRAGVSRCLVEIGGEVMTGDAPPEAAGWQVGVATGVGVERALVLTLRGQGVATSGDLEQFVEIGGVRYSHIVDPRTGFGLTYRTAVVVIAPDCTTADALATAVSVLGPRAGLELVAEYAGVEARIESRVDGMLEIVESPGFVRFVSNGD